MDSNTNDVQGIVTTTYSRLFAASLAVCLAACVTVSQTWSLPASGAAGRSRLERIAACARRREIPATETDGHVFIRLDWSQVYFIADRNFSLQVNIEDGVQEEDRPKAFREAKALADELLACASPAVPKQEAIAHADETAPISPKKVALPARIQSAEILPLKSLGDADRQITEVLYTLLPTTIHSASPSLKVIAAGDLEALVGLERMKDAMGCDNTTCAAEMTGALGVDSIIFGSVNRLGSKYLLSLTWIDSKKGIILSRHIQPLGSQAEAFDIQVEHGAAALLAGASEGP